MAKFCGRGPFEIVIMRGIFNNLTLGIWLVEVEAGERNPRGGSLLSARRLLLL